MSEGGALCFTSLIQTVSFCLLQQAPHKADKAGRTWLELDPERCKKEIQEANALGLRLIGYWHTHPQVIPQISGADISSFSRFAQRYSQVLPHPVAIIVGTSPDTSGIKAWSFREGMYIEVSEWTFPFSRIITNGRTAPATKKKAQPGNGHHQARYVWVKWGLKECRHVR